LNNVVNDDRNAAHKLVDICISNDIWAAWCITRIYFRDKDNFENIYFVNNLLLMDGNDVHIIQLNGDEEVRTF
jgi:hypothetical protein